MLGEVLAHQHVEQVGIAVEARICEGDQLPIPGGDRVAAALLSRSGSLRRSAAATMSGTEVDAGARSSTASTASGRPPMRRRSSTRSRSSGMGRRCSPALTTH